MGALSGGDQGHDSADAAESAGTGETDGLVVGFAFHSPLDIWAILPDWLEEVEIKRVSEYRPGQHNVVQAVFGHERDLKKLGIPVVDGTTEATQELTAAKLDVILRQHIQSKEQ